MYTFTRIKKRNKYKFSFIFTLLYRLPQNFKAYVSNFYIPSTITHNHACRQRQGGTMHTEIRNKNLKEGKSREKERSVVATENLLENKIRSVELHFEKHEGNCGNKSIEHTWLSHFTISSSSFSLRSFSCIIIKIKCI